jgi:hypothetical protein
MIRLSLLSGVDFGEQYQPRKLMPWKSRATGLG